MQDESHELLIPQELDGSRADQALARLLPQYSRSRLARLISEGRLSVEGKPVTRSSQPLAAGTRAVLAVPAPRPSGVASEDIAVSILYEDEDLAVIDKPPGLVVHPAAGHSDGTLVNALLFRMGSLSGIGGVLRPGIVHRLDKDTSGVMVIAKNDEAHRTLAATWGSEGVRKEYVALVYGSPRSAEGTIEAPIGRDPHNRKRMAVVAGGRAAVTLYRVTERLPHLSLLRCVLKTGRTHQIRVHLKSIGHPIVGDTLYSGPQWKGIPDRRMQKLLSSFPRQALHASRIRFPHPRTGEVMSFEAPLAEDMARLVEELRGKG